MKKLSISIIIILIGIFVLDRVGGNIMWWVNQHTNENAGLKIRKMVNEVNADILLMGTSRCNRHYVPSIISDSVGLSVYNGGIDASDNIYSHYTLLNLILPRYSPKVICLEVSVNDFTKQPNPFSTVSFFAPYFGHNEQSDTIFHLAELYWQYRLSYLYRFNAKATPYNAEAIGQIDYQKISFLQKFIHICSEKGILLVFSISPLYSKVTSTYYTILKNIAKENNIPILDYHTKQIFLDRPDYFEDGVHLWDMGACIYSSMFAHDLKEIIQDKI